MNVQDARHRIFQLMPSPIGLEPMAPQWATPRPGGDEQLAGTALHRALGRDPAWHAAGQHRGCLGRGEDSADAAADGLRRLCRAEQAGVAHPLPGRRLQAIAERGLITFERNRYSVPASFANRPVSLRIYPDRLVVVPEARLRRDRWTSCGRADEPGRASLRGMRRIRKRSGGSFPRRLNPDPVAAAQGRARGMRGPLHPLPGRRLRSNLPGGAYHMKAARFPAYKDMAGFRFEAGEIGEALVRQLHRCPRQRSRTGGDTLARSSTAPTMSS